ncbi:formate dehydrogenase subunit gamma [Natronocella acetinitrilica]|uniref:Formate dehydrogenase subunit gamma n=1 Tax=Natronocella acetinitrilica TaxID=414046 RepID=A0AAE3G131_9GAMM|nr:formate dehydrogenase subunit gamma [Natronocella acetinitrilica]MCP1673605.1 formate dehydrogenase subunit gamma [Natronocella acetinitrilica]
MSSQSASAKGQRRWRAMMWSLLAIIALAIALPSMGYLAAHASAVYGPDRDFAEDRATNPRSDMWRDARVGEGGFTTQTGPYVTNTMISNVGENWRQIRTGPMVTYGGWALVVVLALISLFFVINGRVKIEGGRSGMTVVRWKAYERFLHWFTALSFIVLAITGLSLLFGRYVLIPVFGHSGFAAYAQLAYNVHNAVGPAFSVGVLAMIVLWVKHNIPNKTDLQWFKQGGGIIGGKHPSAGKMNGGEKVWFWGGVFTLGLVVIISGSILLFPNLGFQTREIMAWSQVVHAIASLVWIALFFGHAYIGTAGTEGALEGMTRGRVDTNWAKQHHDLWYEDLMAKGEKPVSEEELRRQKQGLPPAGAAGQPGH